MTLFKTAGAVCVAIALVGAASTVPEIAHAQTATDLKCKGCVGKRQLGKKAVKSKHIKDGAIAPADLSPAAQPSGADTAYFHGTTALSTTGASILSVTISAPAPGYVVAMAQWVYHTTFDADNVGGGCALKTVAGLVEPPYSYTFSSQVDGFHYDDGSLSELFEVPAGDTTIHLNCRETKADMSITYPKITAFFVPNRY